MKKIMFTMLAACAICATAQASAVDWQFTTKNTSTAASGGTVYLILGTAGTYDKVADVIAAAVDSAAISASGSKLVTGAQTWDTATGAVGSTASFSYVLVDAGQTGYYVAATGLTGTYYDPSDTLTPPPAAMSKTVSTAITASSLTSFSGGSGGGGGDIPEPTSGLLLLVGAGMLALRRKQK